MVFVDQALAGRLEAGEAQANVDYARTMQRVKAPSDAQVLAVTGGYVTFVNMDPPVLNRAIGLGMSSAVTDTDIEQIETFLTGFNVPVQIDVCPLADMSLADQLGKRGYRVIRFFNKHIRDLAGGETFPEPPPGITVEQAAPDDYDLWARVANGGKNSGVELTLARLCCERPDTRCFLARVNGEPAGNGALSIYGGLATLFYAATLPEFRQRGVQTALLHARLSAAVEAGCDLATVAPIPGTQSERNVQRQGFGVAYTRVIMERL
jgi:GNAT superfamily N-acetyltransferase